MGAERFRRGAARHRLQHRRFHFLESFRLHESPDLAHDRDPLLEHISRMLVRDQVEIALAIPRLDVLEPVPFFRQRPERFSEQLELVNLQRRLAGFGEETFAFDADEIAEIDELETLDHFRADFFRVDVNLDASRRIAQVDEMAFPHVAMRRDPAGGAQGCALGKFFSHLADGAGRFEAAPKRIRPACLERLEFFAPLRDEIVFVVHRGLRLFSTFPEILIYDL